MSECPFCGSNKTRWVEYFWFGPDSNELCLDCGVVYHWGMADRTQFAEEHVDSNGDTR